MCVDGLLVKIELASVTIVRGVLQIFILFVPDTAKGITYCDQAKRCANAVQDLMGRKFRKANVAAIAAKQRAIAGRMVFRSRIFIHSVLGNIHPGNTTRDHGLVCVWQIDQRKLG